MIYLDSSALLKLLFEEAESAVLAQWITDCADTPLVSSHLAKVEVIRATRRLNADLVPAARALLSQLDLIPITDALIDQAADIAGPVLRTLDALYLASALSIRDDLTAFVAYDHRLNAAAASAGIQPTRPTDTDPS